MGQATYVHIVDDDCTRRAKMARQLYENRAHAEIYEDLEELIYRAPSRGVVLISDDRDRTDLKTQLEAMQLQAGYLPVGMFSSELSAKKIVRAMSSGALDYIEWPCSPGELIDAVAHIADAGERKARGQRLRAEARQLVERLTSREKDVLKGLVGGASNREMAQALGISPRTVEIHRANMMSRLNAQSAADAVRIGLYAGMDG